MGSLSLALSQCNQHILWLDNFLPASPDQDARKSNDGYFSSIGNISCSQFIDEQLNSRKASSQHQYDGKGLREVMIRIFVPGCLMVCNLQSDGPCGFIFLRREIPVDHDKPRSL